MKSIIYLFLIFFLFDYSSADNLVFEHITIENGLPNNTVYDIMQDTLGFIWFATRDGLVKYDGFDFKKYTSQQEDSTSLSHDNTYCIYEDKERTLWIGTYDHGLNRFNRNSESFTRFIHDKDNENSISDDRIQRIYEDSHNIIWIATYGGGLNIYNRNTGTFEHFFHSEKDTNSISSNFILDLFEDRCDDIWIGTVNGLNKFNRESKSFYKYFHKVGNPNSISSNRIYSIYEDKNGTLWIGTLDGLNSFNRETNKAIRYKHDPNNPQSLSHNRISCISEDSYDNLWIGTLGGGLNKFNTTQNIFERYNLKSFTVDKYGGNYIHKIYEDRSNVIWMGTASNGIKKIDRSLGRIKHLNHNPDNPNSLAHDWALSVCETSDNLVWIGSANGILTRYNSINKNFKHYKLNIPANLNGIKTINDIVEKENNILYLATSSGLKEFNRDSRKIIEPNKLILKQLAEKNISEITHLSKGDNGELWIGTNQNGLIKFNEKNKIITHYLNSVDSVNSLSNNTIFCIYHDSFGNVWIGTNRGLNIYQPESDDFKRFLIDTSITSIFEDKNNKIWIGTFIGGICVYDNETDKFVNYSKDYWFSDKTVYSILDDDFGNLWLAMDFGILKINIKNNQNRLYSREDGLSYYRFNNNAVCRGNDGTFYFGSYQGMNIFHPAELEVDSITPGIIFTDLKVSQESVPFGVDHPLKSHINIAEEVNLSYWQNDINIKYSSVYYSQPYRNKYAYLLENWDKDWHFVDNNRNAIYSNLSPGEYIFKVKAANKDGVWNEQPKELKITIFPPFWKTWWAYSLYFLFLLGIYFTVRKYELNRLRLKHDLEMKDAETNKLMELDQLKSRFFVNISHEFRTPLTLILGNLDKLSNHTLTAELKNQYEIITRNAKRLLRLVNQLLDFSKIDAGKMKLQVCQHDIIKLIKPIVLSFQSFAEKQQKKLVLKSESKEIIGYFDHDKIEKILYNLLSNAFKFTGKNDQITVEILQSGNIEFYKNNKCLHLIVEDNGVGIKQDDLDKIFEAFGQLNDKKNNMNEGTGIGLALTKELVEIHRGRISVQSEFGKYTRFEVTIPIDKNYYSENEITFKSIDETENENKDILEISENQILDRSNQTGEELSLLLIVEDDQELRAFIKSELISEYKIIEAENGDEGFEKATDSIPDIIISDVMMPIMDGFEFAKKIKKDITTNHIPIILLTARVSDESKIEGLETGADDFLAKPFKSTELKIKLKNMINHQNRMHEKFRREFLLKPGKMKFKSPNEQFIKNITEIIESNLSKLDFSIEELSRQINMSRIHLYRKTKAITGQTCIDFVRSYKLRRAAQLLIRDEYTISEICFMTGFNEPSNFAKVFKKQFGKSPSNYLKDYLATTKLED